jgi:cytochrome c biogenesis protein CcdA
MGEEERGRLLVAAFVAGLLLVNFPLLAVVGALEALLGRPLVHLYLFLAWALIILGLAWIVERGGR